MSTAAESPYNRFQHAATNTTGPVTASITSIPLNRTGPGAEMLQALRMSSETGALRPRRESMDSFNSLHRFTQQTANGLSTHGQTAAGEAGVTQPPSRGGSRGSWAAAAVPVPASRGQRPAVPRPSSSGAAASSQNVWASAHFTYKSQPVASVDEGLLSTSGSVPGVVMMSGNLPSVAAADAYNATAEPPLSVNGASPAPPQSRSATLRSDALRGSYTSNRDDAVMMSYMAGATTAMNDNATSPHDVPYLQDASPTNGKPAETGGVEKEVQQQQEEDDWASHERRLVERRNAPLGTDVNRPVGGVRTMLRDLQMVRPRIPAINESVEVRTFHVPATGASALRHAALWQQQQQEQEQEQQYEQAQEKKEEEPHRRDDDEEEPLDESVPASYRITRDVVVTTRPAPRAYVEAAVDASVATPHTTGDGVEAEDGAKADGTTEKNSSSSACVGAQAATADEPSVLEAAAIPAERRRSSYAGQLYEPQPPSVAAAESQERRVSVPSIRSIPITRDVQMDELDALVPQAHPPNPPSSAGSSRVASKRATPALQQSAEGRVSSMASAAPRPTPPPGRTSQTPISVASRDVPSSAGTSRSALHQANSAASSSGGHPQPRGIAAAPRQMASTRTSTSSSSAIPAPHYTSAGAPVVGASRDDGVLPHSRGVPGRSIDSVRPAKPSIRSSANSRVSAMSLTIRSSAEGVETSVLVPPPRPTDTTHVYSAARDVAANACEGGRQPQRRQQHASTSSETMRVPAATNIALAPHDCIPDSFHAPLPAPLLIDAVVPRNARGGQVMHFQPTAGHAAGCAPGTVKLTTTTLSVEERKVRYLPLDAPFDPDAADVTDKNGVMPMADTFALLHPSDYGRVLLANQPTVLTVTDASTTNEESPAEQWAVQPTYLANNNSRWVRRSNRVPVATTHDPAGRAPETSRRLERPPLTEKEAQAQAARAPYEAFPAYRVTTTMNNRTVVGAKGRGTAASVHDAPGGFLLQRHVQQIATGQLLNGTSSQIPTTRVARPYEVASVPTSIGSRTEASTPAPSSTHSAPVYRVPRRQEGSAPNRAADASRPSRHEPTVRGSAEDARGTPAMTERLPAIPGYAHSGTRPPLPSQSVPRWTGGTEDTQREPNDNAAQQPAPVSSAAPPSSMSRPVSHTSSQPPAAAAQHVSTTTTRQPASTLTDRSSPYVPSVASSSSVASSASQRQPHGAHVTQGAAPGAGRYGTKTPSVRAASSDTEKGLGPATVGKPAQKPSVPSQPQPTRRPLEVTPTPSATRTVSTSASANIPASQPPSQSSQPSSVRSSNLRPGATQPSYLLPKAATAAAAAAQRATTARPQPQPQPPVPAQRRPTPHSQQQEVSPSPDAREQFSSMRSDSLTHTHSASLRHDDDDASSLASDGVDPVTEVQNHTMIAPLAPAGTHHATHPSGYVSSRYNSESPSLVQPSEDSSKRAPQQQQWQGVASMPTVPTNHAATVGLSRTEEAEAHTTNNNRVNPKSRHERRTSSEMAVFPVVTGPPPAPTSQAEYLMSTTTVHHSERTHSTSEQSLLMYQPQQHTSQLPYSMQESSADTQPIAVSERSDDESEEDLTKKVRPTTLIVDGDVYELPRHESEELYFVPDEEGDVYFDEQGQAFYPVDESGVRVSEEEEDGNEYDEL